MLIDGMSCGGSAAAATCVWIWKHNPSGMFADWNPDVSCEHAP